MKKLLIIALFLGSYGALAQDCNALLFAEGAELTYTQFDKKGQENGKTTHKTTVVKKVNDKVIATLEMAFKGEKENQNFNTSYTITCADGIIGIDMVRFFDATSVMNYEGADFTMEIEGDILEFPSNLSESSVLNDGHISVKVVNNSIPIVTVKMDITNRKMEGIETITTPAGTFKCTKISYDYESKVGFIKVKGRAEEWYATDEKIVVQTMSYNKKGKEIGSTQLTAKK